MQFNPAPPPLEPPPPPPPDPGWWTPPQPGSQWTWPATPTPPPLGTPAPRHRLLIVLAVVASVAVVAMLAVGLAAASRQVHSAVPDIVPGLSLPPVPTPPPVTDVQPLPSTLPAGSAVASVAWSQVNDGVVAVMPSTDGIYLTMLQVGHEETVPIPVPSALSALRVDATLTATNDSNGNEIGLACTTADRIYGARFSINARGDRFMWLNWPGGPTKLNGIRPGVINSITTANQLSAVCIEHSKSFEMMFAINGTVVADEEVPQLTTQPLFPALYVCSCFGQESTRNSAISVSSIP